MRITCAVFTNVHTHTQTCMCLTNQLARYPPWRMTTCVSRRYVNPVAVVSRVLYPGKGEYRRDIGARKFSYSRPAYISTLWRRCVAETVPQRRIHMHPERSVLGDAVHSLPKCPIWKFMGYPICALNTPLYMRCAFQYIDTSADLRWRYSRPLLIYSR